MTTPLNQGQQNVFDLMSAQLSAWGLNVLNSDLRSLVVAGDTSPDTLTLALSQTSAYKARFAGNEIRVANGMSAMTPAEYLATENSYQQVLRAYGLPSGFYDSPKDFADFIGKNVSASELDARAKVAHDQYESAPGYVKELWGQYYGSKGDAVAAILDPSIATQTILDRGTTVGIGGAAAKQGIDIGLGEAQRLQQAGITAPDADKAFSQIAQSQLTDQGIAQRFGTTMNLRDEEDARLTGDGPAQNKLDRLYAEEGSLFKNRIGMNSESLGVSQGF